MNAVPKARHYKDLLVWQKGIVLAREIYRLTSSYPNDERFGLISQMRRAAVSVPSNIAEGQARQGTREFLQFISHASGSLSELETQLLLSVDLQICSEKDCSKSLAEVGELQKMLSALRRSLGGFARH
jgi:four helix bundle protein